VTAFRVSDWRAQDRASRTPRFKRFIYDLVRPVLAWQAKQALAKTTLSRLGVPHAIGPRGTPLEYRRAWALRGTSIRDARLLVQGTGTGWDVLSWAEHRPASIIATDLFEFRDSWDEIAKECKDLYDVKVEFRAAPLENHDFLESGSIDLCASDAVFEHCTNLDGVMTEAHRLLKPSGRLYASYGPLWWGPGGDHFSGRGGLSEIYNHVALTPDEYQAYFKKHVLAHEDFQSGGRYVELDLFSRLDSASYFACFRRTGFSIEDAWLQVSDQAIAFRDRYPLRWTALSAALPSGLTSDDLLISGHLVRLRPHDKTPRS